MPRPFEIRIWSRVSNSLDFVFSIKSKTKTVVHYLQHFVYKQLFYDQKPENFLELDIHC